MRTHPVDRDRFRVFLVRNTLASLLGYYLAVNIVLAFLCASIVTFLNFESIDIHLWETYHKTFFGFLSLLFGGNANPVLESLVGYHPVYLVLLACSVLLPGLLLGAIVFKVTTPTKKLAVFSKKLELNTSEHALEARFYLATSLQVFDLSVKVFVKFYKKTDGSGNTREFPLSSFELPIDPCHCIPQPFSFVPTLVKIPITIAEKGLGLAQAEHPLTLVCGENSFEKIYVKGHEIAPHTDDFCDLYIVVSGEIPSLQTKLNESEVFDVLTQGRSRKSSSFDAKYDRRGKKYVISKWENF